MGEIDEVREQVAIANRILAELGLATGITASLGHASLRLPSNPNHFVVKGRGYAVDVLSKMRPEDMVVCNTDGFKVEAAEGLSQPREIMMHSCIYKARPEVQSVVHVHPRFVVLMSVMEQQIQPMCQEGIQLVSKPLPVYPHVKTVWSLEEGLDVAKTMGDSKAIILYGHGATTAGRSLVESVMDMLRLEEQARMNYLAVAALGPNHPRIPDALINEMSDRPQVYTLPHFRDEKTPEGNGVWDYYADLVSSALGN